MRGIRNRSAILALASSVLLLCTVVACQDQTAVVELEKHRARAAVEEQNATLVTRIFDGLNERNEAVYQELYAPDYRYHFPANSPNALTREEEAANVKMLWTAFPDMHWAIEEMIARDDIIVARFIARGTHNGEYQGLPPTGIRCEGGGVWIGRIENGKVVEAKEEFDVLGWMQQLGQELKPKDPESK